MDSLIERAEAFARKAHEGQLRKFGGQAYIHHPERVANTIAGLGFPPEMVAAAWLHDVVEDCGVKIEEIYTAFGPLVANYVMWLTKSPDVKKADYYASFASAPPQVHILKLADRLDNVSDLHSANTNFRAYYVHDTRRLLKHLDRHTYFTWQIEKKLKEFA